MTRFIVYHDAGPDRLGRRSFTRFWVDEGGIVLAWVGAVDGEPVGYRRGQCFFCKPDRFLTTHTVATEAEAEAAIAKHNAELKGVAYA